MTMAVWRCRNHAERLRLLDMSTRLRPAKRWSMGLLVIAALVALPSFGWAMEVPLVVAAAVLAGSQQLVARVRRPEDVLAAVWLCALIAIVAAIGLAHGPRYYTLYILLVPTLLAAPVFPPRVAAFGGAITIAAMVIAAFAFMPGAVLAAPPVLVDPAAITIVIGLLAVRTLEVERASRDATVLDPLTGLLNRGALQSRAVELHRVGTDGEQIAVIVGDIDRFKSINDDHGHAAGDEVLVEVARRLERVAAAQGAVYRFWGKEFVVLVEGGGAASALGLAEDMRAAVAAAPIAGRAITLSLGVSISTKEVCGFTPLFSAADRALYRAKAAGRNCVRAFPPEEGEEETVAAALDRRAAMLDPPPDDAPRAAAGVRRRHAASAAPKASATGGRGADAVAREERGSLILPTVADRQHMLAIVYRTREISKAIEPVVGVALLASVPWFGWYLLVPIVLTVSVLQVILFRVAPRSARPEYPINAGLLLVTLGTGASIVLCEHDALFALPFFVILMFSNSAGLPARGATALALVIGAIMCATALLVDARAVEQLPSIVVFPLTLLGLVTYFGFAIGRMTFDQRELLDDRPPHRRVLPAPPCASTSAIWSDATPSARS